MDEQVDVSEALAEGKTVTMHGGGGSGGTEEEPDPRDRMIQMQAVTIGSLQNRIFQLEMQIIDLMSAGHHTHDDEPG